MDEERIVHDLRAPTNATSHGTGHRSNGTTFTGINPRNQQQRSNGRLSLNRHRTSHQANPTRADNSSNTTSSSSRNDTQLPSIPNIRFRSVRNQPPREMVDSISPLADINVRSSGEGTVTSSNIGTGAIAGATNSSRRPGQTRDRFQLQPAAMPGSIDNVSTSPSRTGPNGRRNGASPRRRNGRNNGGSNTNNHTSSSFTSTLQQPRRSRVSHRPSQWRSDDSDEDITLMLMSTPPGLHDMSMDDFETSHDLNPARGLLRGIGTAEEPFELTNDPDVAGPAAAHSSLSASLSRDEEFARQLQQEEWERAATPIPPMAFGYHEPVNERLQFLQAMHQALGDDGPPRTHNAPRRGRARPDLPPVPVFMNNSRGRNSLQIPALLELLPPGLMEAILGNGQFPQGEEDYEALLEMGDQIGAVSRGMAQRDINKIPTQKHKRAETDKSSSSSPPSPSGESQCAICLSEFNVGDTKRILTCQHELHKDCIDPWLKTNATCPICRTDIRDGR